MFLSFRKDDLLCSFRIPDPDFSHNPDFGSGSRGQKSTGSRVRIRNIDFLYCGHTWGLWLHWGAHYGKYTKDSSVPHRICSTKSPPGAGVPLPEFDLHRHASENTKPLWNRDDRELMHKTSGLVHREVRRNFVSNRVVDSWNQLPVPSEVKIARKVGMLRWL